MKIVEYNSLLQEVDESKLIQSILQVYKVTFKGDKNIYTLRKVINKFVKTRKATMLLCINDTSVLGYCFVFEVLKTDRTCLYRRYSETNTFGFISEFCSIKKGCGTLLMNHVINDSDFKDKDLILTINKKSLIHYYHRFGFIPQNVGKNVLVKAINKK